MKRRYKQVLFVIIFLQVIGCADDPLLKPVEQNSDNYSFKDIKITNNSADAVGLCENYYCDFNVPAGQTSTVQLRYLNFDKTKTQDYLRITIQTAANRQIAVLKSISWPPFLKEGSEIKWLGNFSGPHSFLVTAELAAQAAGRLKDDEDYSRDIESDWEFARLLNLSDANLTLKSQIFQEIIEVTLPENDSEIFWGSGSTAEPDGLTAEGNIVVNGWRYERVPKSVNKVLFSGYTKHVNFTCNNGGCFPDY
jgi:hypothetical protein